MNTRNRELLESNKKIIKNQLPVIPSSKRILYIVPALAKVGGVETRLRKQLTYLTSLGYQVAIMTWEGNACRSLLHYPNLTFCFSCENFTQVLAEFIEYGRFDIIEFQFKETDYLTNIDFRILNEKCQVGCCIHQIVNLDRIPFKSFDYAFTSLGKQENPVWDNIPRIPNWTDIIENTWCWNQQKKALFISRFDREKWSTLESFAKVCEELSCDFEIAGNITPKVSNQFNRFLSSHKNCTYIGEIDTENHLRNNSNRYLFIGGVGQVPLEALSFGIPALVSTHQADYLQSRFVTKQNLHILAKYNLVIKKYLANTESGNIAHFQQSIQDKDFSEFSLCDEVRQYLSEESVMQKYLSLILRK